MQSRRHQEQSQARRKRRWRQREGKWKIILEEELREAFQRWVKRSTVARSKEKFDTNNLWNFENAAFKLRRPEIIFTAKASPTSSPPSPTSPLVLIHFFIYYFFAHYFYLTYCLHYFSFPWLEKTSPPTKEISIKLTEKVLKTENSTIYIQSFQLQ